MTRRDGRSILRFAAAAAAALLTVTMTTDPLGAQRAARFEVYEASISRLQEALTRGETTSVELVEAYLARIEAYDRGGPELNAILRINPAAREEAARLDRERAERGARGPLHGIPIVLKDNYDTADMPTTGSTIALAMHRPLRDAFQVARLREAGAIVLAKTNLTELAYGITTISSLGGQTLNPYDPTRNPGGSSGGTGAAVAASFAAIGWGSDTCGSIRIPAGVHNLVGLRPTKGLSSIDGIIPLSHSQDTGGPLARTVTDLAHGLDATIGIDPADPATAALEGMPLPRFADALDANALEGARIGVLTHYFGDASEERETSETVRAAIEQMAALGAEVVEVEIDDFDELLTGVSLIDLEFKWDLRDYLARTPEAPVRSLGEIVAAGLHHEALTEILRRSDRHETLDSAAVEATLARRAALHEALVAALERHALDAFAYPTLRREAARIGEPALGSNCQLSAATGMPALTLPAGFSTRGVPIGFELLGRRFEDARLVAIGYAYEQAVQPRRAPPFTPPLEAGAAPTPRRFSSDLTADGATVGRVELELDPVLGTLGFTAAAPPAASPGSILVIRRGSGGPILHVLVGPDGEPARGTVRLSAADRRALEAGELVLQRFGGTGPGPVAEGTLVVPSR